MIDFRDELNKFKPILEIDGIEVALQNDDMKDVLDMVRHMAANPVPTEDSAERNKKSKR